MSRKGNVFVQLEKFIGCKYSIFLKNILSQSGFDCESALLLLNEDKIKKNELEVAANLESYRNLFKKTVYETRYEKNQNADLNTDGEFHFLIGHRELLLSIPESLKQKNARKKNNETIINTESSTESLIEDLSNKLISKINKYFEEKKLNLEINNEHIIHVNLTDDINSCTLKCVLKCYFCEMQITNSYKTYWHIGNYTRHISKHSELIKERQQQQEEEERREEQFREQSREQLQIQPIQRSSPTVLNVVENILRYNLLDKLFRNFLI